MDFSGLNEIRGLKFMPVRANKMPIIKNWQQSTDVHNLSNCEAIGLVCGHLSGNIEVIDVDQKYSLDGRLFETYKNLVHSTDPTILSLLVVEKTKGGGFHLIYRCSKIAGNLKLANRHTTEEERKETYEKTYKSELLKSTPEDKSVKIATKASEGDTVRVLLETRGEGGYIMCAPSEGYDFIYGDFCSISEITPEQREVLFSCAMQLNEVFEERSHTRIKHPTTNTGLSPFDDYNQRGDVIALLQEHGWKVVKSKGSKTHMLRPGQSTAQTSGNFDHDKNWFSVFTTSTDFEPMHAYLPYAVFATLECNKDFSLASKKLFELGYGERKEQKKEVEKQSTRQIPSRIEIASGDKNYFASPSDYDGYLQQVMDGTLQMGKTTGIPSLDNHFLFKHGNLVMINGIDNVGKTEGAWFLLLLSAMYHSWKIIVFSSENTIGAFVRRTMQLFLGMSLKDMTPEEFKFAKTFVEEHFKIIKAQEDLFNYKDILNLIKIARSEGHYDAALIDPYNSLKVDLSGFSKLNTHEYHYEALSEIKAYGQQTDFGFFITAHAVTAAIRMRDADRKYAIAPRKEDTEHGAKFPNKADDFITWHRITNHPTDWMISELHVRKIKDTETGGRVTPIDSPVKLQRYGAGYKYAEWLEGGQMGIDPVEEWHIEKRGFVSSKKIIAQSNGWLPYKDDNDNPISF
jgi:hypothetical protein